ncbi:hypothetical protein GCM10027075_02700 [Streptomyces heilongjiangensis]
MHGGWAVGALVLMAEDGRGPLPVDGTAGAAGVRNGTMPTASAREAGTADFRTKKPSRREGGDCAPPAGLEPAAKRLEGARCVRSREGSELGGSWRAWRRPGFRRQVFDTGRQNRLGPTG